MSRVEVVAGGKRVLLNGLDVEARITELEQAEAKVAELEKVIADHNAECETVCAVMKSGGNCHGYPDRQRQCPDCPKNWRVEQGGGQ